MQLVLDTGNISVAARIIFLHVGSTIIIIMAFISVRGWYAHS